MLRAHLPVLLLLCCLTGCERDKAAGKLCIDQCGDSQCQEIVCLGSGCPCAESAETCPQDCAAQAP